MVSTGSISPFFGLSINVIPIGILLSWHLTFSSLFPVSLLPWVLYWLVLCQLDTAGVITEKGASVEEMPP